MEYVRICKKPEYGIVNEPLYKAKMPQGGIEAIDSVFWSNLTTEKATNSNIVKYSGCSALKFVKQSATEYTDIQGVQCFMVLNIQDEVSVDRVEIVGKNSTSFIVKLIANKSDDDEETEPTYLSVYCGRAKFVKLE